MWKNEDFTLTEKNSSNQQFGISLVKPLLSRKFCQKCVRVNFRNFHTVYLISRNFFLQILFLADWWSNSEIRIHASKEILEDMDKNSAIVLMNHHYELDWCFGWMVADRFKVLGKFGV